MKRHALLKHTTLAALALATATATAGIGVMPDQPGAQGAPARPMMAPPTIGPVTVIEYELEAVGAVPALEVHVRHDANNGAVQVAVIAHRIHIISLREGTMGGPDAGRSISASSAPVTQAQVRSVWPNGEVAIGACKDTACREALAGDGDTIVAASTLTFRALEPGQTVVRSCADKRPHAESKASCLWRVETVPEGGFSNPEDMDVRIAHARPWHGGTAAD